MSLLACTEVNKLLQSGSLSNQIRFTLLLATDVYVCLNCLLSPGNCMAAGTTGCVHRLLWHNAAEASGAR